MITLLQWADLVKINGTLYYWKDGQVMSAPTAWFRKLCWDEQQGFVCGMGNADQLKKLEELYLSEQECAQDKIREIKQKYCKEAESK